MADTKNAVALQGPIRARYTKMKSDRQPYLDRARECAKLTIPSLVPPEGANGQTKYQTPYQSVGAKGVNKLAAKLLLTLFPPNQPFFKFTIDEEIKNAMAEAEAQSGGEGLKSNVDVALSTYEQKVQRAIETSAMRVPFFEGLKNLIIAGNILVYMPDDGGVVIYRLDQYVCKRDPKGNLIEVIIEERIHPAALEDDIRNQLPDKEKQSEEPVEIYTQIVLVEGQWVTRQQVADIDVPGSEGTYKRDESPYMALRWTAIQGEDYGRGHAEEYLGDLLSLENLAQAIVEGAFISSRMIPLVDPTGVTKVQDLNKAKNGTFVSGKAEDVTFLQAEKAFDLRVASDTAKNIEDRLASAFLMVESIQRNGERVTAEEIRRMAKELEDTLGGVYSVLSAELQLPIVRRLLKQLTKGGNLPALPAGVVEPAITTGLDALGRGNDVDKLGMFMQVAVAPIADQAMPFVEVPEYLGRMAAGLGIDKIGLIKTAQQVQAENQANMQSSMIAGAVPGVAQEVVKGVMNGGNGNQNQQTPQA